MYVYIYLYIFLYHKFFLLGCAQEITSF